MVREDKTQLRPAIDVRRGETVVSGLLRITQCCQRAQRAVAFIGGAAENLCAGSMQWLELVIKGRTGGGREHSAERYAQIP